MSNSNTQAKEAMRELTMMLIYLSCFAQDEKFRKDKRESSVIQLPM